MALEWENLVDGKSEIVAGDINKLAGAIKDTEQSIKETNQSIVNVNTNLQKAIDEAKQSLGNDIEEKTIVNDVTNTSIRLNDSSDDKFRDIDIADTTNNEVTVDVYKKNLIDSDLFSDQFAKQEDGSYKAKTTIRIKDWEFHLPAGRYALSYKCKSPSGCNYRLMPVLEDGTLVNIYKESTGDYITISGTKTFNSPVVALRWGYAAPSAEVEFKDLQIEFGETTTEFEEFKGKQSITLSLPLTDEGKEQFKTLHSNKPVTTILNDKNIEMTVDYEADTKAYIDNKFNELNNAILSIGGNV